MTDNYTTTLNRQRDFFQKHLELNKNFVEGLALREHLSQQEEKLLLRFNQELSGCLDDIYSDYLHIPTDDAQ